MPMRKYECKGCGLTLVALRTDTVTCSPRCRQRYKRACDRITQLANADALTIRAGKLVAKEEKRSNG